MCVYVCAYVHVCVCMHACVCACMRACECVDKPILGGKQLTLKSPGAGVPELQECTSEGEESDHSAMNRCEQPSVFWNDYC